MIQKNRRILQFMKSLAQSRINSVSSKRSSSVSRHHIGLSIKTLLLATWIHLPLKIMEEFFRKITKSKSRLNCARPGWLRANVPTEIHVHLPMAKKSSKRRSTYHLGTRPNYVSSSMKTVSAHMVAVANSSTRKMLAPSRRQKKNFNWKSIWATVRCSTIILSA